MIPIRPTELSFRGIRQALQRIEQNFRTGPTHNFTADRDPLGTDDESQGYSVTSMWYHVPVDRLFICTDATKGDAQWYNPFDGAAAFGSGEVAGTGHNYASIDPPTGDTLSATVKGDTAHLTASGGITITGDSATDTLAFAGPEMFSDVTKQTLTAGSTITATDGEPYALIDSASAITLTSEPHIAAGRDGQLVILKNVGAYNIIVQDVNGLGGCLFRLTANSLTIQPGGSLALIYDSTIGFGSSSGF